MYDGFENEPRLMATGENENINKPVVIHFVIFRRVCFFLGHVFEDKMKFGAQPVPYLLQGYSRVQPVLYPSTNR